MVLTVLNAVLEITSVKQDVANKHDGVYELINNIAIAN